MLRPVDALVSLFRVHELSVKAVVSWGVLRWGGHHVGVGEDLLGFVKMCRWLWRFPDDVTLGSKIFTSVGGPIAFASAASLSSSVISSFSRSSLYGSYLGDRSARMREHSLKHRFRWVHPMACMAKQFVHVHFLEFLLWSGFLW